MRFPEFSGEWEKCKVSDLLDFYSTNSLAWEQLEYGVRGLKNLHYGLIHNGLSTCVDVDAADLPTIKESCAPKKYTLCKEGDVAFADASEDTNDVAKCVEFTNCAENSIVCGLHTIHGRDKSNKTVIGFKGYAFSAQSFRHQIRRLAQGTKIYSINSKNFSECYIGIPSKEEQSKIATLLSLIDQRIETQKKIIEKYESLIRGLITSVNKGEICKCKATALKDVLTEVHEKNVENHEVCSVSVSQGVVNQIDYLGRSFAAKEVLHYNVVNYGDIVYTKSPTGEFPYGIVKRSNLDRPVAVSPLYGVYRPVNDYVGIYLHLYFKSPVNTKNYLHRLIQKGAKNTINITNQHFLDNQILIPEHGWLEIIVNASSTIEKMIQIECDALLWLERQKNYLLSKMFI